MDNIGIIGFGFVGSAVAHGFAQYANIKIHDKYNNVYDSLESTVNDSDFLFVSVPTPMLNSGKQDHSYLDNAILNIDKVAKSSKIIIIKSTVVPGTTRKYAEKYTRHNFVFNPEFLTERTAKLDFINPSRIIIGGCGVAVTKVENLYRTRFTATPIYKTTFEAAEVVKYMNNTFFAVKISFLNEMYKIAEYLGVEYNELRDMWLADYRIGNSHTDVPGQDGDLGFGGRCFPKDIQALMTWAKENNLDIDMCKAAERVNKRVRTKKDWLDIKGATENNKYEEK